MTTKRTPIKRPHRPKITPKAITIFRSMQQLVCTCPPPTAGGVPTECPGCAEWLRLHNVLHRELNLRPWQFPCIAVPGTEGATADQIALYRELEAAARGAPSPWAKRAKTIRKLEGKAGRDQPGR